MRWRVYRRKSTVSELPGAFDEPPNIRLNRSGPLRQVRGDATESRAGVVADGCARWAVRVGIACAASVDAALA